MTPVGMRAVASGSSVGGRGGTGTGPWRPLKALLGGGIEVPAQFEISDLTMDSRHVMPGAAFLACPTI